MSKFENFVMLCPKGDVRLGAYNLERVDGEESLECVGKLNN